MTAPLHRSVDMLSGQVLKPTKFFEKNADADDRIAELELLRSKTPEWEVLARKTAQLVDTYLHHAADDDQRTQLVHMAGVIRHYAATAGAVGRAVADYQDDAVDQWAEKVAAEDRLVVAERRIAELETRLAQACSERDSARAKGGVL